MRRFEAATLEEAYAQAARAFTCSVTDLQITVLQHPAKGIFGFGRKNAVIEVSPPEKKDHKPQPKPSKKENPPHSPAPKVVEEQKSEEEVQNSGEEDIANESAAIEAMVQEVIRESTQKKRTPRFQNEIFDNFYQEKPEIDTLIPEIKEQLQRLFSHACFDIDPIEVSAWNENTLLIEIRGKDAALLIGKEGYRYKALAHLLYSWIHGTYGVNLRLEIAEFLKNQEAMIDHYLQSVIERIEKEGRAQTKVLDGILVQIALRKLRERYSDKYVAIRTNKEGGRYVIINEFMEKR